MEQTSFKFQWTDEYGCPTMVDPNLFSSIVLSAAAHTTSQSSSWSISGPSSNWKVSSIDTRLVDRLEAIERRLAILNLEESPTHQMLDMLYKKYKMVEALVGKENNDE